MFRKVFILLICSAFIFEQTGFCQISSSPDISGVIAGIFSHQSKFRPVHFRSLSYDSVTGDFEVYTDKGDAKNLSDAKIKEDSDKLFEYFLTGLVLPNNVFWVNLHPDRPDMIIDPLLATTDVGRILLEADLLLKKEMARLTSPENALGKEYWNKLYAKAETIFGSTTVTLPALSRPWIVPGDIIIAESATGAYVYKATLNVMLEQDYLKNSSTYNFSDTRLKELNDYSAGLIREIIIPVMNKELNSSSKYASLRQVFYSLILAQWFKKSFRNSDGEYGRRIDSRDLTGLASRVLWNKNSYFQAYKASFEQGEYNLRETVNGGNDVRRYFSGGLALMNLMDPLPVIAPLATTTQGMITAPAATYKISITSLNIVPTATSGLPTVQRSLTVSAPNLVREKLGKNGFSVISHSSAPVFSKVMPSAVFDGGIQVQTSRITPVTSLDNISFTEIQANAVATGIIKATAIKATPQQTTTLITLLSGKAVPTQEIQELGIDINALPSIVKIAAAAAVPEAVVPELKVIPATVLTIGENINPLPIGEKSVSPIVAQLLETKKIAPAATVTVNNAQVPVTDILTGFTLRSPLPATTAKELDTLGINADDLKTLGNNVAIETARIDTVKPLVTAKLKALQVSDADIRTIDTQINDVSVEIVQALAQNRPAAVPAPLLASVKLAPADITVISTQAIPKLAMIALHTPPAMFDGGIQVQTPRVIPVTILATSFTETQAPDIATEMIKTSNTKVTPQQKTALITLLNGKAIPTQELQEMGIDINTLPSIVKVAAATAVPGVTLQEPQLIPATVLNVGDAVNLLPINQESVSPIVAQMLATKNIAPAATITINNAPVLVTDILAGFAQRNPLPATTAKELDALNIKTSDLEKLGGDVAIETVRIDTVKTLIAARLKALQVSDAEIKTIAAPITDVSVEIVQALAQNRPAAVPAPLLASVKLAPADITVISTQAIPKLAMIALQTPPAPNELRTMPLTIPATVPLKTVTPVGGVDLGSLPTTTMGMNQAAAAGTAAVDLPALYKQWNQLQKQLRLGKVPFTQLNEFLRKAKSGQNTAELLNACAYSLADILRKEEDNAELTSDTMKQTLAYLFN